MTLDEMLRNPPKVHEWGAPNDFSYSGFAREFYTRIAEHINATSSTLETGAGISTVVFALRQARHTCIAPDAPEFGRLKAYCAEHGIATDCIDFQPMRSDEFFRLWQPRALDLVLIESGGDNLAATFSPELADLTLYVIDVAAGDKIPSKGGPGITRSDLLVINKIDLAPHVGASLTVMERDARRMRGKRPFVFTNIRAGDGVWEVADFIQEAGGLAALTR